MPRPSCWRKPKWGWATETNQFPNRDRPQALPLASPQPPMDHVFNGDRSTASRLHTQRGGTKSGCAAARYQAANETAPDNGPCWPIRCRRRRMSGDTGSRLSPVPARSEPAARLSVAWLLRGAVQARPNRRPHHVRSGPPPSPPLSWAAIRQPISPAKPVSASVHLISRTENLLTSEQTLEVCMLPRRLRLEPHAGDGTPDFCPF
jgi:hypothetical protein